MRHHLICGLSLLLATSANAELAAPNASGVAFSHMHVVVADVDLHRSLWAEIFDANLIEREGYTAASVPGALIFFREAEPTAASDRTVVDHFGFEVRDLSGILAKWRSSGYAVDSDEEDAAGTRTAVITIPDGIKLSLTENPGQSEFVKMGHVHFATAEYADLVNWYARLFGAATRPTINDEAVAAVPGAQLLFNGADDDRQATEGSAIDHIGFEIEDWDEFVGMIEAEGIEFEFGPVYIESLDLWVAFFEDPSGALVEISHGLDAF